METPWLNVATALALGLLLGLERERAKGEGAARGAAGIRTFALATLLGALAVHVAGQGGLMVVLGGVAALASLAYLKSRSDDPGLTTEVALVSAPLLGALAMSDLVLASAVGVMVAFILAMKTAVHHFAKRVLTDAETHDLLVFAIATIVIWPQLPDRAIGPYQALNPHSIWLFVLLVLGIGACGHVLTRVLGPRYGLPLAGLASGFVSSTATIGVMAARAAKCPAEMKAAVAGAALSTVATFVQLGLLLAVVSPASLAAMARPLLAGGTIALVYGLAFTIAALRSTGGEPVPNGRAFSISSACVLALTLCVMLVASAALRAGFGEAGMVLGAALAGLVDTHAAAISVASLVAASKLSALDAVFPILAAMTTNMIAKASMSLGAGDLAFARRVLPGLVMSNAASWLAAVPALTA